MILLSLTSYRLSLDFSPIILAEAAFTRGPFRFVLSSTEFKLWFIEFAWKGYCSKLLRRWFHSWENLARWCREWEHQSILETFGEHLSWVPLNRALVWFWVRIELNEVMHTFDEVLNGATSNEVLFKALNFLLLLIRFWIDLLFFFVINTLHRSFNINNINKHIDHKSISSSCSIIYHAYSFKKTIREVCTCRLSWVWHTSRQDSWGYICGNSCHSPTQHPPIITSTTAMPFGVASFLHKIASTQTCSYFFS